MYIYRVVIKAFLHYETEFNKKRTESCFYHFTLIYILKNEISLVNKKFKVRII